jgi:hypothetical protein
LTAFEKLNVPLFFEAYRRAVSRVKQSRPGHVIGTASTPHPYRVTHILHTQEHNLRGANRSNPTHYGRHWPHRRVITPRRTRLQARCLIKEKYATT